MSSLCTHASPVERLQDWERVSPQRFKHEDLWLSEILGMGTSES